VNCQARVGSQARGGAQATRHDAGAEGCGGGEANRGRLRAPQQTHPRSVKGEAVAVRGGLGAKSGLGV